jgi:hypothetical protein
LRHLPYVGKANWKPTHPVDEPVVLRICGAYDCHEPLTRRGQKFCSTRCRVAGKRRGASDGLTPEQRRTARIQAATLANDAIDACRQCDDDGRRLDDGSLCDHS